EAEVATQETALKAAKETLTKAKAAVAEAEKKLSAEASKLKTAKTKAESNQEDKSAQQNFANLRKAQQKLTVALQTTRRSLQAAMQDHNIVTRSLERSKAVQQMRTKQAAREAASQASQEALVKGFTPAPLPACIAVRFESNDRLCTVHEDGTERLWNATNATPISVQAAINPPTRNAVVGSAGILQLDRSQKLSLGRTEWKLTKTFGEDSISGRVTSLGFSPDGLRLAVGSGQPSRTGQLQIYAVPSGNVITQFPDAHSDTVLDVEFSPDGTQLLSCGSDKLTHAWDVAMGDHIRSYEGHTHHVLTAAWQPDMTHVATGGADNVIKIWDAETGEQRRTIRSFGKHVTALQWVGSADTILAGSGDRSVRRLTTSNGRTVKTYPGAADYIHTISTSADESIVIAGCEDGTVRVWNLKDGKQLAAFTHKPPQTKPR
ncbi:MAG: hypothetical protein AB8G99_25120, partial [Planctomycetaceae bacterium]